jgi:hypothetical protein
VERAIVGRSVPDANDVRAMRRAVSAKLGWMTVGRMLTYATALGLISGYYGLTGFWSGDELCMILGGLCLLAAIFASVRGQKLVAKHCLAAEHQVFTISDESVWVAEPDNDVHYQWRHFEDARETPTQFILRHGLSALVLPKRAFSEEDSGLVRAAIASHVKLIAGRT